MKRIIDGRRFDTQDAMKIASWNNGRATTDFQYLCETLYRTTSGVWFMHGAGGAMTEYHEHCGDMLYEGKDIVPLSYQEAQRWCERHNLPDVLEKHITIREA